MKWLNWVKPTSPFVATASLIITVVGGIIWLIAKLTGAGDVLNDTGFWIFYIGLGFSILMLVFWSPYKVNQEDNDKMSFAYYVQRTQEENLSKFISIEPAILLVREEKDGRKIATLQTRVRSTLLKPVTIKAISGNVGVFLNSGKIDHRQFKSRVPNDIVFPGLQLGNNNTVNEVVFLDCQDNWIIPDDQLSSKSIHVNGYVTVDSDQFKDLRIDFQGDAEIQNINPLA